MDVTWSLRVETATIFHRTDGSLAARIPDATLVTIHTSHNARTSRPEGSHPFRTPLPPLTIGYTCDRDRLSLRMPGWDGTYDRALPGRRRSNLRLHV